MSQTFLNKFEFISSFYSSINLSFLLCFVIKSERKSLEKGINIITSSISTMDVMSLLSDVKQPNEWNIKNEINVKINDNFFVLKKLLSENMNRHRFWMNPMIRMERTLTLDSHIARSGQKRTDFSFKQTYSLSTLLSKLFVRLFVFVFQMEKLLYIFWAQIAK